MAELIFYEKPGCVGNLKQQSLLRSQGISFTTRDLLSESWSAQRLRPYFGKLPVAEWFNATAPRVKSGEVAIDTISEEQALELMINDPILIRRPLLELGGLKQSGFVPGTVLDRLGVLLDPSHKLQDCPMQGEEDMICETSYE